LETRERNVSLYLAPLLPGIDRSTTIKILDVTIGAHFPSTSIVL